MDEETKDKEIEKRRQELSDLRAVMATDEGARFIYRLINDICAYDRILCQNSGSMTYFDLGERNIGRIIKGEVYKIALDRYQAIERERNAETS